MALTSISLGLAETVYPVVVTDLAIASVYVALLVLLGLICRSDIRNRRIPNRLVAAVALLGIAHTFLVGELWTIFRFALMGGVFALVAVPWQARMIGGADVKLILASLIWIEPTDVALFAVLVTSIGALLAITMVVLQGAITAAMQRRIVGKDRARSYLRLIAFRTTFIGDHPSVPYALAIAAAQAATLALSAL